MIKIYYDKTQQGVSLTHLLYPNFKIQHRAGKSLFSDGIFKQFTEPVVAITGRPEDADFILLPHNYGQIKDNQELFSHYVDLAKLQHKRLIIFAYGDIDYDIDIPEAIIFKNALYRFKKKRNEIKLPLFVEDLGARWGIDYQAKAHTKPSVGFCGWAEYASLRQRARAMLYHQFINVQKSLTHTPELETLKQGIYFRKKILHRLEQSTLIESKFIRRSAFFLHKNTITVAADAGRQEFVANIKQSNFSLAVRGDMNDSARLYEIMSLGRIPVLLDTETVLPFEGTLDYSKCLVRIPYPEIMDSPEIISKFYREQTSNSLIAMQKEARRVFEKQLRVDAYFISIFASPEQLLAELKEVV
ncbi:MAG: exostosin family protein [Candidatus Paceibacterota bacterium]|jgi:hypothetical protein